MLRLKQQLFIHEVSEMQTKLFGKRLLLFSPLCKRHIRNQSLLTRLVVQVNPNHSYPCNCYGENRWDFWKKCPSVKQRLDGTETHRLAKHTKPHFENPPICSSSCFPCCHLKHLKSSKVQQEEKVRRHLALQCSKPAFSQRTCL